MTFKLTLTEKPGYLHAVVTGANSLENVVLYLKQLRQECTARGFTRVLIEENFTGRRLETWDVYQIASESSLVSPGGLDTIAYVDVNAHGELMKFAETVANNRGVPLNVFTTVEDAEAWLRRKIG